MFWGCKPPFFGLQSSNLPVGGSVTSEENENTESGTNMATHGNPLVGKSTADWVLLIIYDSTASTAHIISKS